MKQGLLIIILTFGLTSCDPVHPIYIENITNDTVTIIATTTIHFRADTILTDYKELGGPYNKQIIEFKLVPHSKLKCGSAIAGIQDELPFLTFEATCADRRISADTEDKIIELFDKKWNGNLKTPYNLTIK